MSSPDPLHHPRLFTHKYDIDSILIALVSHPGPYVLDTTSGEIRTVPPSSNPPSYVLNPLPTSYLEELAHHPSLRRLPAETQQVFAQQLQQMTTITDLQQPLQQAETSFGGWIHERLKETAMEWLDQHDLIPPSLKHVHKPATSNPSNSISKVVIQ